jgi:hypothetical protein
MFPTATWARNPRPSTSTARSLQRLTPQSSVPRAPFSLPDGEVLGLRLGGF